MSNKANVRRAGQKKRPENAHLFDPNPACARARRSWKRVKSRGERRTGQTTKYKFGMRVRPSKTETDDG